MGESHTLEERQQDYVEMVLLPVWEHGYARELVRLHRLQLFHKTNEGCTQPNRIQQHG